MQHTEVETLVNSLKLVDGVFSPSNASDLLKELINTKINFHKLNRLSLQEGNHEDEAPFDNSRILELESERENFWEAVRYARENNKSIKLKSTITIEYIDK